MTLGIVEINLIKFGVLKPQTQKVIAMKTHIFILIIISSCFQGPVEPKKDQELEVIWIVQTNNIDAPSTIPLVIANKEQIVYTGEVDLVALNMNSGEEVWRANIDGERALESIVLLYDESSGRIASNHYEEFKVWDANTGEPIYTLTDEDGILAFRRGRNTLVNDGYGFVGDTLDAYVVNADGSIRFEISVDFGTLGVAYGGLKLFLAQSKTLTGALTLGKIRAFDSRTGDSLWIYETNKSGFGNSAPIIENGILYASTIGNSATEIAVALDVETGGEIWKYESDYIFTRNSALGPRHYYVNTGGSLAALNKENGNLVWRVEWMGTDFNKPVYLDGYVYHVRDHELLIIDDESGEVVHREPVPDGGGFFWHVAVSSDKVFAQTSRQLIAYQPWHLRGGVR